MIHRRGDLRIETDLQSGTHSPGRRSRSICDEVWIAAKISAKGKGREADKRYRDLCRRLGIGMLGVSDRGEVSILVGSVSPMPRTNPKRRSR